MTGTSSFMFKWAIAQFVALLAGLVCYPSDTIRRRLMVQVGAGIVPGPGLGASGEDVLRIASALL